MSVDLPACLPWVLCLLACWPMSASCCVVSCQVVYVESSDFREDDAKDYYGLAPGKSAMLR